MSGGPIGDYQKQLPRRFVSEVAFGNLSSDPPDIERGSQGGLHLGFSGNFATLIHLAKSGRVRLLVNTERRLKQRGGLGWSRVVWGGLEVVWGSLGWSGGGLGEVWVLF